MRLSDIMSNMELSTYPQVALIMFLAIFSVVVIRIINRRNLPMYEAAALIPLSDAPVKKDAEANTTSATSDPRVEEQSNG